MELFSELYNCYFQVVNQILRKASVSPLSRQAMESLISQNGYEESAMTILPKLTQGEWSLFDETGASYTAKVHHLAAAPFSVLQKSWLKALLTDPRISLFFTDGQLQVMDGYLADVDPLFYTGDFLYFDRYLDGDPYGDRKYQEHFRLALKGTKEHRILKFSYISGKQKDTICSCLPCRIEYSSKDDKFRLLCLRPRHSGRWRLETINMARILAVEETAAVIADPPDIDYYLEKSICREPVVLKITNERNALERTMIHFSSYEKRTERIEGTNQYLCSIYYDKSVETELLIQILSFGPTVRVMGPAGFLELVKERVKKQMEIMK